MATEVATTDRGAVDPLVLSPEADAVLAAPNRAFDDPRGWGKVGRYVLLVGVCVIVLFPVYTTVVASLKPGDKVRIRSCPTRSRSTCCATRGAPAASTSTS